MMPIDVVIMAAGKGTRMKSKIPKVLHTLGAKPLLGHVIDAALELSARKIVLITGHESEWVRQGAVSFFEQHLKIDSNLASKVELEFALQMPQLGTGHAVQQAAPLLEDGGLTLILSGDVPLTQVQTLKSLVQQSLLQGGLGLARTGKAGSPQSALSLLTLNTLNPFGYGRVIRDPKDSAKIIAIVEEKDATPEQKKITEVYTGVLAAATEDLRRWVNALDNKNAQNEYYLTDVVKSAVADGVSVSALAIDDPLEVMGVNSPAQLAELERAYQLKQAHHLMQTGVRLKDPTRIDIRGALECGPDVEIDINCIFKGVVKVGSQVRIGPNCVIDNALIEDGAILEAYTHIEGASPLQPVRVGALARVGPFARLRPGAVLGADVHVGNFVEIKNSTLAAGAKANHLAYVGDAVLGERVNFGAGSITANYDGANKHQTVIEQDVHIGSNCVLVAPLTIGAKGTVGAGSTITKDTPPGALTITRAKQASISNWTRPVKEKK
jgi:bifunctional UDP-N-acetylglucosamine pyrophosphorylase/glucosamine-1-phosphate N-acetyltransferase